MTAKNNRKSEGGYTITRENLESVTDAEASFGTTKLLPSWDSIPEGFKKGNEYTTLVCAIFFGTPIPEKTMIVREGFDQDIIPILSKAVLAHLRSWEPKHEHKMAGVGFMVSCVVSFQ